MTRLDRTIQTFAPALLQALSRSGHSLEKVMTRRSNGLEQLLKSSSSRVTRQLHDSVRKGGTLDRLSRVIMPSRKQGPSLVVLSVVGIAGLALGYFLLGEETAV